MTAQQLQERIDREFNHGDAGQERFEAAGDVLALARSDAALARRAEDARRRYQQDARHGQIMLAHFARTAGAR
jgi:hypothetical protein